MVYGQEKLLAALENGTAFDKLLLDTHARGALVQQIKEKAFELNIPLTFVPEIKLNFFNVGNHEGCIGVLSKIQYADIHTIIPFLQEQGKSPLLLILDGITDVRNIGGIARTAFCYGVDAIIIADKGVAALNEAALLSSAGALEQIPVCRVSDLLATLEELKLYGIQLLSSEMKAEKEITEIDLTVPVAIIMGSEDKGIQSGILKMSTDSFKMSMLNPFDSLNVSVSTGIVLYEVFKQRHF